jgi:hypothetical protein
MIRRTGRKLKDLWIYFKTGHSGYLVYSLSILNLVVLQHRLLISYIPFLSRYMSRLRTFIIVFVVTYIPLSIFIGYFEFRKGEVTRKPMLNPYTQDTLEATDQIEESLAILQRWKKEN